MAIFGSFGARRGPKMACSNLFQPNITYPNIFTLIFSRKKKKKIFLNLTTLLAHSDDGGEVDGTSTSNKLGVLALAKKTVNPSDGERQSSTFGTGLRLGSDFTAFASS